MQLFTAGAAPSPGLEQKQLTDAFDELRKANAQLQAQLGSGSDTTTTPAKFDIASTPMSISRMSRHFASPKGKPAWQANSVGGSSPARPPSVPLRYHPQQSKLAPTPGFFTESIEQNLHALPSVESVPMSAAASSQHLARAPGLPAAIPPHDDTPLAPTAPASSLYQAAQAWRAAAAYSEAKATAAAACAQADAAQAAQAHMHAEQLQAALRAAEDQQADTMREKQNFEAEVRGLRMHLQALAPSDGGGDTGGSDEESGGEEAPTPAALAQLHALLEAAHVEVQCLREELVRVRQQREAAAAQGRGQREAALQAVQGRQQRQHQLRQAQAVAFVADEQVRQLREECAELQRCIASAGGLQSMTLSQQALHDAQQDAAACRAHNEELLSTLEGVQSSLSSLTGAVHASEEAAAESAAEASQAAQLRAELQAQIGDAQEELSTQHKRAEAAETQAAHLEARVTALQLSAQADAQVIASLKQQLATVNNELDATLSHHETRMQSLVQRASPSLPAKASSPPPRPRSLSPSAGSSPHASPPQLAVVAPQHSTIESPIIRAALMRTASPVHTADPPPRVASPLTRGKPAAVMQLTTSASTIASSDAASSPRTVSASASPGSPTMPSVRTQAGGGHGAAAGGTSTAATAFTIDSGQAVDPSKAAFMEHKLIRAQVEAGLQPHAAVAAAAAAAGEVAPGEQGATAAAARSKARARAAAAAAQKEARFGDEAGAAAPRAAYPPMIPTARVVQDNHKRLRNALSRVLLAAEAHTAPLAHALDAIESHDSAYIVACFVSGHSTVRGRFLSLLALNDECTAGRRIWGKGPRTVTRDMMRTQYKFDTVSRDFVPLFVGDFSFVTDGVGVDAALVKVAGLKAPSLTAHTLRGDASTVQVGGTVDLGSDSEVDSQHGIDEMLLM